MEIIQIDPIPFHKLVNANHGLREVKLDRTYIFELNGYFILADLSHISLIKEVVFQRPEMLLLKECLKT